MDEKGRTLIMGDIHGAHKALEQCLERSNFDFENDKLIQLGDVCDGWPYVYECVEILLKVNWLIPIKGNHDAWFHAWLNGMSHGSNWEQGASATAESYIRHCGGFITNGMTGWMTSLNREDVPNEHVKFFRSQHLYFKDKDNNLFVHGGFNRHYLLDEQPPHVLYWDRDLWHAALSYKQLSEDIVFKINEPVKEVFIGHTATTMWGTDKPMKAAQIWNLDTGAGWGGKLTIMDLNTKEYWQSDKVSDLYPDEVNRR